MKVRLQLLAIAYLLLCYMQTKGIGGAGNAIGAELGSGKGKGPTVDEMRIGPCNLSGDCRDEYGKY
jgi:hypothetical protein